MAFEKRCFVISPIGLPDSPERERADAVFDLIIGPALKPLGVEAVRADKLAGPGQITDQMIEAILEYDFCIADVSGHNPNVFYELALAQAAERPVVIMKIQGDTIPFDVKDYRLVEYDLKPQNIKRDVWLPVLQDHVKVVLQRGYKAPPLLRGSNGWRSDAARCYLLNARSEDLRDAPHYLEVVQQASEFCDLMGISLQAWGTEDARKVLQSLHQRRVPTRILVMDDAHPGLPAMFNSDLPSRDYDSVKRRVVRMGEYFENLARTVATLEVRRLRRGMPHFQLIITESTALVLQYMFSRGTDASPLQQVPGRTELHDAFREEFNILWETNQG